MALGKAINQFDVATSAENKRVLGYDTNTDVTCQIPVSLIKDGGQVIYDQVIRTQAEFNTLIASPTWLGAVTVALVGEFGSSTNISVPATVKRIDGYKCKITGKAFICNGCIINDIEVVSSNPSVEVEYGFSGSDNTYTNCTGTGDGYAYGYGFSGNNNAYYNCTGTGTGNSSDYGGEAGYGFSGANNTYTNCTGTGNGENGAEGYGFSGANSTYTNCTGTGNVEGFEGNNNTYTNCTGTGDNYGFYTYEGNNTYLNCTAIGGLAGIECGSTETGVFMIIKNCKFPSKAGITTASTTAVNIQAEEYESGPRGVVKDCLISTSFSTGVDVGEGIVTEDNFAILL